MPMPELPYGGPITMPGGPFTPRPDLGPGVGFGPGLPPPGLPPTGGPDPIQGMPTPGMPGGKSAPMPGPGVLPPGFDDTYDGPQMIGGAYGQPIYGGRPNPMPPSMYGQPQPNFASALGTQSPFLNTVQR